MGKHPARAAPANDDRAYANVIQPSASGWYRWRNVNMPMAEKMRSAAN
jgi:hypothetical protein